MQPPTTSEPDAVLGKIVDAVNADKARDRRQLVVYLALTAVVAVTLICDILSDIFLHARHVSVHTGGQPTPIWMDWDITSTISIVAWMWLSVRLWRR